MPDGLSWLASAPKSGFREYMFVRFKILYCPCNSSSIRHFSATTKMEDISSLSHTCSRAEHIAYLTNELGLDKLTAATLHRGERLQEKGQLQQAIYYFENVLKKYPECPEASVNLRIVKTLLEDKGKEATSMPVIPEKQSPHSISMFVTDMEVTWSGVEDPIIGYIPDPDECAVGAAEKRLRDIGYGNSMLKMISNIVTNETCDAETGWVTYLQGKALFRVTLIPETNPNAGLEFSGAILAGSISLRGDRLMNEETEFMTSTGSVNGPGNSHSRQTKKEEVDMDPAPHRVQQNRDLRRNSAKAGLDQPVDSIFMDAESMPMD
jgi:hypothetical protein